MPIRWNSFLSFRDKVKQNERYFYDEDIQVFLHTLLTFAEERVEIIPKGQQYWRAQKGYAKDPCYDGDGQILDYNAIPFFIERMKPDADKVGEGRINSKGIPCLYLATNEKTAISEVRPWVGSYVTIAQFETVKELKIIACSRCEINPMAINEANIDMLWKLQQPPPKETIETVWRWVDLAFSEPVDREDKIIDYVPTQIIAEFFKTKGFDGIKYRSLFNGGDNLALYDIDSAKQIDDGRVIQIAKISVDYKLVWPTQFQREKKDE